MKNIDEIVRYFSKKYHLSKEAAVNRALSDFYKLQQQGKGLLLNATLDTYKKFLIGKTIGERYISAEGEQTTRWLEVEDIEYEDNYFYLHGRCCGRPYGICILFESTLEDLIEVGHSYEITHSSKDIGGDPSEIKYNIDMFFLAKNKVQMI